MYYFHFNNIFYFILFLKPQCNHNGCGCNNNHFIANDDNMDIDDDIDIDLDDDNPDIDIFEEIVRNDDDNILNVRYSQSSNKKKQKFMSCRQFYKYKTMVRDKQFNTLHRFGPLWQQYLVDNYIKCETNDLNYLKFQKQNELCSAYYDGLLDAIANDTIELEGKPTILPPSFSGGPRSFHGRFQDAMAIVREFGKPDLFITMTCNPKWKEIKEALDLLPGETAYDRPDIVARVFHQKIKEMLHDLLKKDIFGKVVGHVEVIEFQKRGLPHCHILLILDKKDKLKSVDDYDNIVSAEIPDEKHKRLHKLVLQHMTHNHTAHCMRDNFCTKWFPKDYASQTKTEENGYPLYKRRSAQNVCFISFPL